METTGCGLSNWIASVEVSSEVAKDITSLYPLRKSGRTVIQDLIVMHPSDLVRLIDYCDRSRKKTLIRWLKSDLGPDFDEEEETIGELH